METESIVNKIGREEHETKQEERKDREEEERDKK